MSIRDGISSLVMIKEAMLWKVLEGGTVFCSLCAHRCEITPSSYGVCGVRQNLDGKLHTLVYGDVIAAAVDPIEKKPLYHFLPGTKSFSIATVGCNFKCGFCQNWRISQASKKDGAAGGHEFMPGDVVREALASGCRSVSYTYTEPTIFFEYAYDTAKLARDSGLRNVFVTNGYMTAEALKTIRPYLDAANVDLKAFRDETYKKVCKARLSPVLDSIRLMRAFDIWVEVTTLVVPGLNDGEDELASIARFIASVDPDIPWHVSRFHPDYKYGNAAPTPVATLERALVIGKREGLRYVYVGNVGGFDDNTHCPSCGKALVHREGLRVGKIELKNSSCPSCGAMIAGVF
jgi:pyruvate formate lyase activating enzyme